MVTFHFFACLLNSKKIASLNPNGDLHEWWRRGGGKRETESIDNVFALHAHGILVFVSFSL